MQGYHLVHSYYFQSSIPGHEVSHATWSVLFAYLERKVIIIPNVKKLNRDGIYSVK